jgi:surfeit locus 1 family protein
VLARLGIWQLDRLQQRRARNTEFIQQVSAEPLALTGEPLPTEPAGLKDRLAVAQGQFDFEQQLILKQQNWQGRPGVHLITPLFIEGSKKAVLVDRGWIPAADAENGDLAQFNVDGNLLINGTLKPSQILTGGRESFVDSPQRDWYRVDIEAIQDQIPYELLPVYLIQAPESTMDELPFKAEQDLELSEGSHLAYAIQWFLFAIILALGYSRFVLTHSPCLKMRI